MAVETYYVGSQDEINKMYENQLFLEHFLKEAQTWCSHGSIPEYPDDGKIYKITLDPDDKSIPATLEEIEFKSIPDQGLGGCTILRSDADIGNNKELICDTLFMWNPYGAPYTATFPAGEVGYYKYFLNLENTMELIKLDMCGRVVDGVNLFGNYRPPEPQGQPQQEQSNAYVVRLAEAPIDINNVRLLQQDGKYIMYPNISPFCRSGIAGARILRDIIKKIDEISNNFADADNAANDNMIDLFNAIEQKHKVDPMSVDEFMNRKITISGAAREFIDD